MMSNEAKESKKKKRTAAAAVLLAAVMLIGGGTWAYLYNDSDDVVNNFSTNKVEVDLNETTGNEYNIIPGTSADKNPTVTVNATVPAYVFVEVTDNTDGLVTYSIESGWTLLTSSKDNNGVITYVYYREVTGSNDEQEFKVLQGDKVYYDEDLVNEKMQNADGSLKKDIALSFTALAIQKEPFADAFAAYLAAGTTADNYYSANSTESLTDALEAAAESEGSDAIFLSSNTADTAYTLALTSKTDKIEGVTLIGTGYTYIDTNCDDSTTYFYAEDCTFGNITFISSSIVAMKLYGNGTFINCTFDDTNGLYGGEMTGDMVFESCTINGTNYGINIQTYNSGKVNVGTVTIRNSDITGWSSFGTCTSYVTIENCTFHKGNYGGVRFYQDASVTNCTFDENCGDYFDDPSNNGWGIDVGKNSITINISNCVWTNRDSITGMLDSNSFTDVSWIVDGEEVTVN